MHDIIIMLRTHRAFSLTTSLFSLSGSQKHGTHPADEILPGPGVSAQATRHLHVLVHALAAMHGLEYVTPSLVTLAARKIYPHRLRISSPSRDRALLYGGELKATREWYTDLTVDDILEEVLSSVEAPL
jgi:MoxR-like ATPase